MAEKRAATTNNSIQMQYVAHGIKAVPAPDPNDPPSSEVAYAWIYGSTAKSSGTVYVNGKLLMGVGDNTTEGDSYVLSTGETLVSTPHTTATGTITSGSSSVYVGGVRVARVGDTVTNHANVSTTLSDNTNTVYVG